MAETRPRTEDLFEGGTADQKSAGRLMKEITEDLSTLVRKEVQLAKQEVSSSVAAKTKGAVLFAIVAVLGVFMLIFLLLAVRDGFDNLMPTWLADLVTVGILAVIGAIGAIIGKKKLATPISADMTKKSIKEDVEWAKTLGRH